MKHKTEITLHDVGVAIRNSWYPYQPVSKLTGQSITRDNLYWLGFLSKKKYMAMMGVGGTRSFDVDI